MSQHDSPSVLAEGFRSGRMGRRQLIRRLMAAGVSAGAAGAFLSACGNTSSTTSSPTTQANASTTAGNVPAVTKAGPTTSGSATSATSAAPAGVAAAGTPKRGGQILMAQQGDWTGYDPHRQNSASLFNYIYDSLVNWEAQSDGSLKATPALATEWQLTDNAAIFKLRQGVKFHDGTDFNAAVVKFNIERMKDAKSAAKAYVAAINSVDVVDPYTVKLNLAGPTGPILSNLSQAADSHGFMISKAMAEKAGDKYGTSPATTAGTGPMKLVEWVPTSYAIVQRTGTHWQMGKDGQSLPYFDSIKTRFIADDAIRFVEVRSGNVQLTDNLQPKDVPTAQQDPALAVLENPFQTTAYQFMFSTKTGPFSNNLKLRQAVHYAINREAVAKVLGLGTGTPMYHFLTPGYLGYDEQLPHYDFNLAKAKQLLAEAGFPSGLEIRLTMINRAVDTQQAQILKQMLEAVGIRVTIDPLERLAYLGPTFELAALAMLFALAVAIPTGIISALRPNSKADISSTLLAMVGASIPHFWLGLLLVLFFALRLHWLPPSGYVPPTKDLIGNLRLMIMPTLTLGSGIAALVMRQTRSSMLEVMRQDYVTTARAKGLGERRVIIGHALRNALTPVATVIGLQLGSLIGGAVITESIFSIPGVGSLAASSIFTRDFPVLQAVVLILAVAVLVANLMTDVVYAWLDPRIQFR